MGTNLQIGWVRDLPKASAQQQQKALADIGIAAKDIVTDGAKLPSGKHQTWKWLVSAKLRSGDTLAVVKLRTIYTPRSGATPRASLFRTLHEIEDMGVQILETSTGRRSSNARDRDLMIADCLDQIARSRTGGDNGAPKRDPFSADELSVVEMHWPSSRHATNKLAVDVIRSIAQDRGMKGLLRLRSPQAFINVFGPSGRAQRKPAKKAKR